MKWPPGNGLAMYTIQLNQQADGVPKREIASQAG